MRFTVVWVIALTGNLLPRSSAFRAVGALLWLSLQTALRFGHGVCYDSRDGSQEYVALGGRAWSVPWLPETRPPPVQESEQAMLRRTRLGQFD